MIIKKLKCTVLLLLLPLCISCTTVSGISTDNREDFARRELGIDYYNQEKYEDAKKELEASLSTADSAKTRFYLNKCNEAILKTTKIDKEPPEIKLTSHADGELVNTPVIKLKGVVSDDYYTNGNNILIQGKKLFVRLAEKYIHFSEDVSLCPGENVISLEASDLAGKSTRKSLRVTLDISPPILYLDDFQITQKDGKQIASLKGTVTDDHALKEFYINDMEMHIHSYKENHFDEEIPLTDGNQISFRVADIAGNEIKGKPPSDTDVTLVSDGTRNKEDEISQPIPQSTDTDTTPPVINAKTTSAVVHDANIFFSGDARDDIGVTTLFVNDTSIAIRPGRHIFFDHFLTLNEGENAVIVKAADAQGNETLLPPVTITKKTFELLEPDARYTVALLPLRIFTDKGIPSETIYSALLKAFDEEPKRFNFVERDRSKLEGILHEQKIANAEFDSPDTAIKIGKICATEGVLFGAVEEDSRGIHITLRLVDTETTRVIAGADVYDEDKSMKNIEWLIHGLSLKIKQQFPMIEGNVTHVSGDGFSIDAGAKSGVGTGMKLLLFRENREGDSTLKEPLDIIARVTGVQPDTSFAKIISQKGVKKIENNDMVITK